MKYEAGGDQGGWWVLGLSGPVTVDFTEAEARIIAFALNAVANGRHLAQSTEIDAQGGFDRWEVYTGPTDGVAPQ